jgi:hypothetical protein
MLKREQTIKGAVVEVVQIKSGLGVDPINPNGILVTKEAGGFFDGGKRVPVGVQLEIVDKPKRRNGISTVVVKFPLSDARSEGKDEYTGHVYWCELRASCKLVKAAPAA